MDWALAIERNREALVRIVASLFALLGLRSDAAVGRIPKPLHRAVLRLLHPAESAVRRLVVIAARGLVAKLKPSRPKPTGAMGRKSGGNRYPSFPLFDRRKRFIEHRRTTGPGAMPRIHFLDGDGRLVSLGPVPKPKPAANPAPPDGQVDARRLSLRLQALKRALEDVPGQARRLARWRARRQAMKAPKFTSPLRPGPPPGTRRKPIHEVDRVLIDCHDLAFDALKPDTS
jgi:hypothetical protein